MITARIAEECRAGSRGASVNLLLVANRVARMSQRRHSRCLRSHVGPHAASGRAWRHDWVGARVRPAPRGWVREAAGSAPPSLWAPPHNHVCIVAKNRQAVAGLRCCSSSCSAQPWRHSRATWIACATAFARRSVALGLRRCRPDATHERLGQRRPISEPPAALPRLPVGCLLQATAN